MDFAEEKAIFILDREGFHPKLGSLTTGSGFAYGLGFRDRDLFSNTGALEILGGRECQAVLGDRSAAQISAACGQPLVPRDLGKPPRLSAGEFLWPRARLEPGRSIRLRDPHEPFRWPRGRQARVAPARRWRARVPAAAARQRAERSVSRRWRTRSARPRRPASTPRADFLRSDAFIEVDYREPRYPKKGGWYRLDFSHYDDRTVDQFTFNRLDADLRQFIGVLAGRRVIAARLFVSTSDTDAGQTMPFYFMPTLGGNDTLRGFREYRFRAPHAILVQGGVPLGDLERFRRRPLLRRRKGREPSCRSRFRESRIGLRHWVPLQHQQWRHPPRRCRVREPRWQAPVYRLWRRVLGRRWPRPDGGSAARRLALAGVVCLLAAAIVVSPRSASPRFYPDDPLWTDDDRAMDASKAAPIEDSNGYDFVVNTFGHPGERRDVRALNVNTVDEVPDSSWFTNRIGRKEHERRRKS